MDIGLFKLLFMTGIAVQKTLLFSTIVQRLVGNGTSFQQCRDNPSSVTINNNSNGIYVRNTAIARQFDLFDLSGFAGTIKSAKLYVYKSNEEVVNVSAQLCANVGTITSADFQNFSDLYGFGSARKTWNLDGIDRPYHEIELNAQAINKLNEKTQFRICSRNYDYDYLNINPNSSAAYGYFSKVSFMEITY